MDIDIKEEIALLKKDIAVNHGVMVGEEDPAMMFVTINQHLVDRMVRAQKILLDDFKLTIDELNNQRQIELNQYAERVLNAAVDASNKLIKQSIERYLHEIKRAVSAAAETKEKHRQKNDRKLIGWIIFGITGGILLNVIVTGLFLI